MAPRLRRVLPAVLAAIPVLTILLALGTWQVRRLAWKTELLARIEASEAGPPVPLAAAAGLDPESFAKVAATGRFRHDLEAMLGAEVRGTALGARLVTPLVAEGRPTVMVDRGWVPVDRRAARIERPEGEVSVTGYLAPPQPRDLFAAADDPAGRRFFTAEPRAIAAALGLPAAMPEMLVALGAPGSARDALPVPADALPRPTNSHLGYAITWYGLAAALIGVLAAWILRKDET